MLPCKSQAVMQLKPQTDNRYLGADLVLALVLKWFSLGAFLAPRGEVFLGEVIPEIGASFVEVWADIKRLEPEWRATKLAELKPISFDGAKNAALDVLRRLVL